jgi:hypothetical protein
MMVELMADDRKRGVDDGVALCLCGLEEYPQPEMLPSKSHHCLILPTTFVPVSIVLLVGIVRVQIRDSKP